ncbi:MAG: hypothetical protein HYS09_05335 [Chloroflexi bacterium]|nr:hypothetical protein [Chloroflexota bacterium]
MLQESRARLSSNALAMIGSGATLAVGLALGHGLMWGAGFLAHFLGQGMQDQPFSDRVFLGGLLLALSLLGLLMVGAGTFGRRLSDWLVPLLIGIAAAPPLSLFAYMFLVPCWNCD